VDKFTAPATNSNKIELYLAINLYRCFAIVRDIARPEPGTSQDRQDITPCIDWTSGQNAPGRQGRNNQPTLNTVNMDSAHTHIDVQRQLFARSERVKGIDFHPTEPWVSLLDQTLETLLTNQP
jgi:hypothetical protein